VCIDAYACQPLEAAYTCRGQFADWTPAYTSSTLATDSGDVVADSRTGLVWQRRVPTIYEGCSGKDTGDKTEGERCTWREAKRYCANLALDNGGWRLPTKAELESLIDDTRSNPTIDVDVFPDTRSDFYWTMSPFVEQAHHYYAIGFETGFSKFGDFEGIYYVRCVR
jgi:hypothetical protein